MNSLRMNSLLNIKESLEEDESIVNYQCYQFYPETGTQLNNPGNITITVNNSDNFYHPGNSWLEFEGKVEQAIDGHHDYGVDEVVSFVNYGILYLFEQAKYCLNNSPIETVFNPALVANIFGLATFPCDFKQAEIECWSPDTSTDIATTNTGFEARRQFLIATATPPGTFRYLVPLKRIFGFADDYGKCMYGFTHNIILTRSTTDNDALCHKKWAAAEKAPNEPNHGRVLLEHVRWVLPRVTPSDVAKFALLKQIKDQVILNCGFRMRQHISKMLPASNIFTWRLGVRSSPEQPRYIFLCFQTNKRNDQQKLNTVYDHCNLASAHVLLNNDRYPLNDFETNFAKNNYDRLYNEFIGFRKKFYGIDSIITTSVVGPLQFKDKYPIYCFDVSRQSERLKSGVTDITLECRFDGNPTDGTIAHAVIISDRKLKFKSDGEKLSVLY